MEPLGRQETTGFLSKWSVQIEPDLMIFFDPSFRIAVLLILVVVAVAVSGKYIDTDDLGACEIMHA
jgi:hypothetical protein